MKITHLETRLVGLGFRNCIVVQVHTDNGLVGLGETVLKRRSKTVEQNIHELARYRVAKTTLPLFYGAPPRSTPDSGQGYSGQGYSGRRGAVPASLRSATNSTSPWIATAG